MERSFSEGRKIFRPIPEAASLWGRELMTAQPVNRETQSGVLGFGRSSNDVDALTVFIAPNTDLSDVEVFPVQFEGERIVYERFPIPDKQYLH